MSSSSSSEAKAGKGFRGKMEHYLYSGDKKHVMAGIVLISAVFAVPWYFMTRGFRVCVCYFHIYSTAQLGFN
ncbi:hypothetical protein ACLB2K_055637 [Fragaria x ananassa]